MKKEEILEMIRKENRNRDLVEVQIENKAVKYGAIGIVILSTIYFCMEIYIQARTNYGWYSIIALYCAIVYGYKGIKTKRKFPIVCSMIWLVCAIGFIYSYIISLLE